MAVATILKHSRELTDTLVTAQLPSCEQVSFRASGQSNAVAILRDMSRKRDPAKDADPVVDGPIELDPPVTPPDPPSQAQLDRDKFFTDYDKERTDQMLATLTPALAARY